VVRILGIAATWITAAVMFFVFLLEVSFSECEHDIGGTARTFAFAVDLPGPRPADLRHRASRRAPASRIPEPGRVLRVTVPATDGIDTPPASYWPGFLVDIAFVPLLPLALGLAVHAGWLGGSFIGAVVIASVFFIDRGTDSPVRYVAVGCATALYLALAVFLLVLGVVIECRHPIHPGIAYAAAGGAVAGLAGLSAWRRFLWGIPIAVLIALVVFFAVYSRLPVIPIDCSSD
jgi:hypothetical protein